MARIITAYKVDFNGIEITSRNLDGSEAALNTVMTDDYDSGALAFSGD